MKSVCVCCSFKFFEQARDLEQMLAEQGIKCLTPDIRTKFRKPENPSQYVDNFSEATDEEKLAEARRMALQHFEKIDEADVTYILAPRGYVGKSVSMEIGYAHRAGKPIYCSERLDGFSQMSMMQGIIIPDDLAEFLKK